MEELTTFLDPFVDDVRIQAGIVIVVSFVVAKITDLICGRVIRSWTGRTKEVLSFTCL